MKRSQLGVALVEFALVLPLLLVMTFIVTEFGRAIYQYHLLTKSVRDAARYLSTQAPGTGGTAARNLVVYGNTTGTGSPLATGLTTSNVQAPIWGSTGTAPVINTVTIRICGAGASPPPAGCTGYSFHSIFTTAFGLSFGTVGFSNIEATMRSSS